MDFANVNSPIPNSSTKIVPDLHGFTYHGIFDSPKSVLSGDFFDKYVTSIFEAF